MFLLFYCFQYFAATNSAIRSQLVCTYFYMFGGNIFRRLPKSEIAGWRHKCICSLPKSCHVCWQPRQQHVLASFVIFCHSVSRAMASQCCFNFHLIMSESEYFLICWTAIFIFFIVNFLLTCPFAISVWFWEVPILVRIEFLFQWHVIRFRLTIGI